MSENGISHFPAETFQEASQAQHRKHCHTEMGLVNDNPV